LSYLALAKQVEARLEEERSQPDTGPEGVSPALAAAYRRYWTTPESEPIETFQSLHREIDILERQVGVTVAWQTLEAAARRWYQEKGACPFCMTPGAFHFPEVSKGTVTE